MTLLSKVKVSVLIRVVMCELKLEFRSILLPMSRQRTRSLEEAVMVFL